MNTQQFLETLFPDLRNGYIEIRLLNKGKTPKTIYYSSIADLFNDRNNIAHLNQEYNVFFGVCPRKEKRGNKEAVNYVWNLWADLDGKDFVNGKPEALKRIKSFLIQPSIVVDSGNGYHVYWRLKEEVDVSTPEGLKRVEAYLKALVVALNADASGAEVARILRLPETNNIKNPEVPLTATVLEFNPEREYNPSDFDSILPIPESSDNDNNYKGNPAGWIAEALSNMSEENHNRNTTLIRIIGKLNRDGWMPNDMYELLQPLAEKHSYDLNELQRQIEYASKKYPNQANSHNSLVSHPDEWVTPINEDAYYGIAGEIVRAIDVNSEADPVATLVQFLTCFGNVIGKKPHFRVGGDIHSLKLFSILTGKTSNGRKGVSWGVVKRIFKVIDSEWVEEKITSGLASGEGLINALSDKVIPVDADKRLLVVETEFASIFKVMGREGSILSNIIRQAWETSDLNNLTKNNPLKASNTHISIIGHITFDDLKKYLRDTEKANGFGNRFLWVCTKRSKCLPVGGKIYNEEFKLLISRLKEAVQSANNIGEIVFDEEATELWKEVYPEITEGKEGIVGSLTARGAPYVRRLACIYALLDNCSAVRPEHLKAGLALWKYTESCVEFIWGKMLGNPIVDTILFALKIKLDGLSLTEISELFGNHKKSYEIKSALEFLSQIGKAKRHYIGTGASMKEVWTLAK